jgi:hypothetical protein
MVAGLIVFETDKGGWTGLLYSPEISAQLASQGLVTLPNGGHNQSADSVRG